MIKMRLSMKNVRTNTDGFDGIPVLINQRFKIIIFHKQQAWKSSNKSNI